MAGMHSLAALVWHYWLAVPLAAGVVAAAAVTIAGYLKKVQAPRYPSNKK
jgi:hypothetical protein